MTRHTARHAAREGLVVRPTSLTTRVGNQHTFNWLFTERPITRGGFVGLYCGTFRKVGDAGYRGKSRYALMATDHIIVPPSTAGAPDSAKYPMAMINEPPAGVHANVRIELYTMRDRTAASQVFTPLGRGDSVDAIVFRACEHVPAGSELFTHYGRDYDMFRHQDYELDESGWPVVGLPCRSMRVADVPQSEWVEHYFNARSWKAPTDSFVMTAKK